MILDYQFQPMTATDGCSNQLTPFDTSNVLTSSIVATEHILRTHAIPSIPRFVICDGYQAPPEGQRIFTTGLPLGESTLSFQAVLLVT